MDTPPIPYRRGAQFTIRPHEPPPPPDGMPTQSLKKKRAIFGDQGSLAYCLRNPPLEGTTIDTPYLIEIVEEVKVKYHRKAQLVAVRGNGTWGGQLVVAKIYDPVYDENPLDDTLADLPAETTNHSYCNESKWYRLINSQLGGKQVPQFFGSYTMDVTYGVGSTRPVRLILMEYIKGSSMRDFKDPQLVFAQRERQLLMSQLIDVESAVFGAGIYHEDIHPRNVMVSQKPGSNKWRVTLIDFDQSTPDDGWFQKKPEGPTLARWSRVHWQLFRAFGWIDWDWKPWLKRTIGDRDAQV